MNHPIAVEFKGEDTADQVLNKLQALEKEYLIDFEDSCVVVRDQACKVHLKQAINLTSAGARDRWVAGCHVGCPDRPAVPQPAHRHGDRRGLGGRFSAPWPGGCRIRMASTITLFGRWAQPLSRAHRRSSCSCAV